MIDLCVVAHCWRYTRLMSYQVSSLFVWPPRSNVEYIVVCTEDGDDRTLSWVHWYANHPDRPHNVAIRPYLMERPRLMQRAIGRNELALATTARFVMFTDVDQPLGPDCIDTLVNTYPSGTALAFPRHVMKCSHEMGDKLIEAVVSPAVYPIDVSQFTIDAKMRVAIGGIQIVPGEVARTIGYAKGSRRHQRPSKVWLKTRSDPVARHAWGTGGTPYHVPNFFRIRHTRIGRNDSSCEN